MVNNKNWTRKIKALLKEKFKPNEIIHMIWVDDCKLTNFHKQSGYARWEDLRAQIAEAALV